MKKIYAKLIATTLILALSIAAVVSASYAWFVLSENPAISGIQVSLSGGNTIMIAADATFVDPKTQTVYHFPGKFSESLVFSAANGYAYLDTLGGLSPVSTADGINWFLPTFYSVDDELVKSGIATPGQLKPVRDFLLDDTLQYANQPEESENLNTGHYVYLDFWVVAPGADYTLRISTSSEGGTYVIDLPESEATANTHSGFQLQNTGITSTAACVRVGFLTSNQTVQDNSIAYYRQYGSYDNRFTSLRGTFGEAGEQTSFMIYEPNADAHPTGKVTNALQATYPVGLVNGIPTPTNVKYQTAIQLSNTWKLSANGNRLIEEAFQTAIYGHSQVGEDSMYLFKDYLQANLSSYVDQGGFIRNNYLLPDNVSAEYLSTMDMGTAPEDVYIVELERNVPQRIRMFVWLEGQDPDWDPTAAGNSFALRIEFAGGTK